MGDRRYWLDLFTPRTWREFLGAGATVSGFRDGRAAYARKVKPGDWLLCYLTGVSRFVGILEVTSEVYRDESPIWSEELFPVRFRTRLILSLEPETGVPIMELLPHFTWAARMRSRTSWQGKVQGSLAEWESSDANLVVNSIREAKDHPVTRPFNPRLLARRATPAKLRRVTVGQAPVATDSRVPTDVPRPDPGGTGLGRGEVQSSDESLVAVSTGEAREHSEIQSLLLRLGHAMGFQLWLDPADRGRIVEGSHLGDLPGVMAAYSPPFAPEFSDRIRRIDVLWLKDEAVVAAFEVEHTTAVYSGLLRMADLLALNPNLNILLFIVAPERRRDKVRDEITRPTFRRLANGRPLARSCRYVSYEKLRERYQVVSDLGLAAALRPEEFLDTLAESFDLPAVR